MSNHQDFLVTMYMDVPLLPENKSAILKLPVASWYVMFRSSSPVSSCLVLQRHVGRPPRCEQRRLFMFPACNHSPVQSECCLKTTSRCPRASCEGAWWRARWGIRPGFRPGIEAVVNVDRSREKDPSWLPDRSLLASDVVLPGNNWTTIGLLHLRCSLGRRKHGISLLHLIPCTHVSLQAIVNLFLLFLAFILAGRFL